MMISRVFQPQTNYQNFILKYYSYFIKVHVVYLEVLLKVSPVGLIENLLPTQQIK